MVTDRQPGRFQTQCETPRVARFSFTIDQQSEALVEAQAQVLAALSLFT
jgi:hypothetical protein